MMNVVTKKVIITDKDTTMAKVIITDRDNTIDLVCEFHILKNVRARCILYCKVKDSKGKIVKSSDLVDTIMNTW